MNPQWLVELAVAVSDLQLRLDRIEASLEELNKWADLHVANIHGPGYVSGK
jgi:hypothetical protein